MRSVILNSVSLVAGVVILAVAGPWLVRELTSLPRESLAARAEQRIVTLEVAGMTCAHCAGVIQSKLATIPGVETVDVRFKQRRAYVVCDPAVADTSLTGTIQRAGPGFLAAVTPR